MLAPVCCPGLHICAVAVLANPACPFKLSYGEGGPLMLHRPDALSLPQNKNKLLSLDKVPTGRSHDNVMS